MHISVAQKIKCLEAACVSFLHSRFGVVQAKLGQRGFSGDGATLFTLVSLTDEEGKEVNKLVKVAWGEFAAEVFEDWGKARYPQSETLKFFQAMAGVLPLYCVPQLHSYLASGRLKDQIESDPVTYLAEHSVFIVNPPARSAPDYTVCDHQYAVYQNPQPHWGSRGSAEELEKYRSFVRPVPYEAALATIRNLALEMNMPLEQGVLRGFLSDLLPDELEDAIESLKGISGSPLGQIVLGNEFSECFGIGYNAGEIFPPGPTVGERLPHQVEQLLDLKRHFNFETGRFEDHALSDIKPGYDEPPEMSVGF